ncbi:zinc-dependent metalloprotease [Kordiimonas aquimaris]|uniref:zinc-dependent metalloprotease n=1 Tax=Kordiimonas aquimaris TaxID=707591 RepID=UPI0021CFEE88|nr:zinc-dependent metalloprotease [Kordiimonas aquimaris]
MNNLIKLACATSMLALSATYSFAADTSAVNTLQNKQDEQEAKDADANGGGDEKAKKKKSKIKKYADVITDKAVTRAGVFTTHLVEGKAYFEIPADQLGREFVWLVKIAGIQNQKGLISADSARQYVYFERIGNDLILRAKDHSVIKAEGEPETFVINAAHLDGVLGKFPIVTFGENETPVIDITPAFLGKVKGLEGLNDDKMDAKTSVVKNVKSFERNVEARVLGLFTRKNGKETESVTAEIRHSILALPDNLMKPRHYNHRVGFFDDRYTDYNGIKNKVETKRYINRWRLEKKDPNAAVSEPVKPIVWYIDRGTPTRYIEATRQGIEFWQSAFEKAGFKNAIIAKMAPTVEEDPDWDPEDARYAVIRWVPSTIPNANGPHVADPRTGEIIEADVRMYHNVIKLIEEWYYAQAGATDPRAAKLPLPDDVMSDLVRFVVAHEVGHSIGLHHNFIGSNAYTIEQLRDPEFVAKNGVASSIMDYARFNYVIQPEDGVSPIDYVPGPYDNFAVEWGYTEFSGDRTAEEEIPLLNAIADRQLTDKSLRWDSYSDGAAYDPRIQTEDIGNDAMEATRLGMKNLERIMANVVDAASYEDGMTYDEIKVAYGALASQYVREIRHVAKYVGSAVYRRELAQGHEETEVFTSYPMDKQREAMQFIADNAFKLPAFWKNEDVLKRVGYDFYIDSVARFGTRPLNTFLSADKIDRIIKFQAAGLETYDPVELFTDVRSAIFEELGERRPNVSAYRRNLQAAMVNLLIAGVTAPSEGDDAVSDDYRSLCRSTLAGLQSDLERVGDRNSGTLTGIHFQNLASKAADALDVD